jgi:murein DD-endopeptidase MepM/ murein hydrolase activator NlpD
VRFPRIHLILVGLIGLGLASFVVAKFRDSEQDTRFTADSVLQEISEPITPLPRAATEPAEPVDIAPPAPLLIEKSHVVRSGDSLARIFSGMGIPARELKLLELSKPLGTRLTRIFPGHELAFTLNDSNEIIRLSYSPGPLETLAFERAGDGFIGREVQREPEILTAYKHASIDHSLFAASQRAGLDDSLTMRLAQIFQWDIDFVLDIRKGDEFYVLFEERYLDDKFIGYGEILAAEFINQKQAYRAVRYLDDTGRRGYFNPDGRNMRKAFLRAPVEFSRISSNFNMRRQHPLYKRTMPHRGIDYAAPTGTPILASGDGKIKSASKNSANGNYIVVQHGEEFVTKYLHLSRFARGIRPGSRVEQGQVIGYVGSTGWATGPHLHYEFLVNGVHQNPRTVRLPDAKPIPTQERPRFETSTEPVFARLDEFKHQIRLALAR